MPLRSPCLWEHQLQVCYELVSRIMLRRWSRPISSWVCEVLLTRIFVSGLWDIRLSSPSYMPMSKEDIGKLSLSDDGKDDLEQQAPTRVIRVHDRSKCVISVVHHLVDHYCINATLDGNVYLSPPQNHLRRQNCRLMKPV